MKSRIRNISYLLFFFISIHSYAGEIDTIVVNGQNFFAAQPEDWIVERAVDGISPDTSWNYILRYQIDKKELNARIALRFVRNEIPHAPKKHKSKNLRFINHDTLGSWDAYHIELKPRKIKKCKSCGLLYSEYFIVPLSDRVSLYILFTGNGTEESILTLKKTFNSFSDQFIDTNERALDGFLLLNQLLYFPVNDTFTTAFGRMHVYYTSDFGYAFDRFNDQYTIIQKNAFLFPLQITTRVINGTSFLLSENDTSLTSHIEYYNNYYAKTVRNTLVLNYKRTTRQSSGIPLLLIFTARVEIESTDRINYYKKVLLKYGEKMASINPELE